MSLDNLTKDEILDTVKEAIKDAVAEIAPLSAEETRWVRLAIENEANRAKYRKAIIEKTLGGLAWSVLGAVGIYFLDMLKTHWK